jgi:putative membrane protein insertion efficiency factor
MMVINMMNIMTYIRKALLWFVLKCIRFYQYAISPHFPPCCRYVPTCSAYAYEAVQKYGVFRGLFMAVCRVLRCHPFHAGGYDPLP